MTAPLADPELQDDYLPIAALNTLLYCERRAALQHIEHVWRDNAFTMEGTIAHRLAHLEVERSEPGIRIVKSVWLKCTRLRIVGKADVVEFRVGGRPALRTDRARSKEDACRCEGPLAEREGYPGVPYPVEYKRGKRRKWDNDDVQLCAQALCLEEMLSVEVPRGAIFHIRSKRRREVDFTEPLRARTEAAAARLHELIAAGVTPPATLKPQCNGCSLQDVCLPGILVQSSRIRQYCQQLLSLEASES